MKALISTVILTITSVVMIETSAQALTLNFSYTLLSGDVISGTLKGDVQPDGDKVFISEVTNPMFNGVAGPVLPFVTSITNLLGGSVPPNVSFSGLDPDFCASEFSDCSGDGFAFDGLSLVFLSPAVSTGISYGNAEEVYAPNAWTLVVVPEPRTTVSLLFLGILGLGSCLKGRL